MKKNLSYILLFLFATLVTIGVLLGEVSTVIEKATTICLNCIGIG